MAADADTIMLATELTFAWLANPNTRVSTDDVPAFLASVHRALGSLSSPDAGHSTKPEAITNIAAVSARKSLASPDRIISMIDGKPYASLKRHLAAHGLTPDEYRERFGLKRDYPMVAPGYSKARREHAQRLGLGRKPGAAKAPAKETGSAPAAASGDAKQDAVQERKAKSAGRKRLGIAGGKAAAKDHPGDGSRT